MQATQSQPGALDARRVKRSLNLIFLVMLMDIVGLTIIIPVAPYIVRRYSNEALMVTALSGIYAAMQFLAAPALGKISDRVGRRPVLLISVFGSAMGYIVFGIGGALWVLFLSRIIDGITGGNLSTASAYIADVSTPANRAQNFGRIGMAFGLGFILGPALGGATSQISIDAPAYTAGILSLLNVVLIYFMLPESLPPAKREHAPLRTRDFNPLVAISEMARKPGLGALLLVTAIFAFAFNGANSSSNVFYVSRFSAPPWQIGLLFVVGGGVTFATQSWLVQPVVGRLGEKTMAIASLVAQALGLTLISIAPQFWMLYPISVLMNGIGSYVWSTLGSLTAGKVAPREQGNLAGVNTALQSLMGVFGPFTAGAAFDHIMPSAPLWGAAILLGIAALIMAGIRVSRQPRPYPLN